MTKRKKADAIDGYLRFLADRDGDPDVYRDTLARREAFYREIEAHPVRSRHRFDRREFLAHLQRRRPAPDLDRRLLWLVATAKANQAERFGVDLGKLYGRGPSEELPLERVHVHLQETYHSRVLADVVGIFGLPVPRMAPPWSSRMLINTMVFNPFPERFMLPLVGMSEQLGCVSFRLLRDIGCELFADEPQVVERMRLLFDEILADEICHVGLVDARLGRGGRAVVRALMRLLAPRIPARMMPEMVRLVGRERLEAALEAPFDQRAWAAEFPEAAYAF